MEKTALAPGPSATTARGVLVAQVGLAQSRNVTKPVAPVTPLTVAVKVTDWRTLEGLGEEARTAEVVRAASLEVPE